MSGLKLKKSLKLKQFIGEVLEESQEDIKKLKNWSELKYDHQLVKALAQKIETKMIEWDITNKKIDKEKLLVEILKEAFNLNEEQEKAVLSTIEFLIENKQILNWTLKKGLKSFGKRLLKKIKLL